jgi:glycerol dehydrogenase-like iron-containing ADH family enzyme
VASNTPGERLAGSSNGAKRPRKDSVSEPATLGTDEQTLADAVQTLADTDQTSSDFDQSASDQEQSASDQDQLASDSDQQASDFLLSCGGDQVDPRQPRRSRPWYHPSPAQRAGSR